MTYTREQLAEKTVAELRQIAKNDGIVGMTKKRKDVIIDAILAKNVTTGSVSLCTSQGSSSFHEEQVKKQLAKNEDSNPNNVSAASFEMNSTITKPSAKFGDRTTTTIRVSCGAASSQFPVVGKTVGAVKEFLREVLNIDKMADGIVNGQNVDGSYVLKESDTLEYLKPAGRKG